MVSGVPGGRARSAAGGRARPPGSPMSAGCPRRVPRTPTRWRSSGPAPPRGSCWWPTTRPPGGGAAGRGLGGPARRQPPADGPAATPCGGWSTSARWRWAWRPPRPSLRWAGFEAPPEVAERPGVAGRWLGPRSQARRDPRRGRLGVGFGAPGGPGWVGIGINVTWPAEQPPSWPTWRSPATTSPGLAVDRVELLVALLPAPRALVLGDRLSTRGPRAPARQPGGRVRPPWAGASGSTSAGDDLEGVRRRRHPEGHLVVNLVDGGRADRSPSATSPTSHHQ